MNPNCYKLLYVFIFLSISFQVMAQKGSFKDVEVISFEEPFSSIVINYYGSDLPLTITDKTKYKGLENKKIKREEIVEGVLIKKLNYKLEGEEYIVNSIETEISANGLITIEGLFEGKEGDLAIIDGYFVKLLPDVKPKGRKKKKCDCKGLIVPSFNSPLISPGAFYAKVKGQMSKDGIIYASKVELCRNTFGKPERELLASVNQNMTDATNPLSNIPSELSAVNMGLYNGEITVGQYSYKLLDDIKLQGYINQIGHRLLPKRVKKQQINQGEIYYRFYVIDDPVPNAFAFPNGMIFIHTGLLNVIQNEAQLAAVLGHEIAHVTHEHGRERYESTGLIKNVQAVGGALFDKSFSSQVEAWAPGLSPSMINSIHEVSQAVTPEALSNIVKPQPKLEAQADRVGLFYAYEAGYDIREAAKFWNNMAELTADQNFQSKITSDMLDALASPRFNYSYESFSSRLGQVGTNVLAKQILDTIYTSHPKAKQRSRAVNKLVGTVYSATDWAETRVKAEKYLEVLNAFR